MDNSHMPYFFTYQSFNQMKILISLWIIISVAMVMGIIIMADKLIKLNQEYKRWKIKNIK